MAVPSGAAEQCFTLAMIRALAAAKDAGVAPETIKAHRAGRPLAPDLVEVVTLSHVEGIPLEYAGEMVRGGCCRARSIH